MPWKTSTVESYSRAVERAILTMGGQLDAPLSLKELAASARMSPYHFNRIFRQMTGVPPCQFLWALRLNAARQRLLNTQLPVIDVCFDVGYNSLGTFTTRFKTLVGISPVRFRRSINGLTEEALKTFTNPGAYLEKPFETSTHLSGNVSAAQFFDGLVLIGLFRTPIPQGRPVSCALLRGLGSYRLNMVPNGRYHLFAAGVSFSSDAASSLISHRVLRGAPKRNVIVVRGGKVIGNTDIVLRPAELTDPPILVSLPMLLTEAGYGAAKFGVASDWPEISNLGEDSGAGLH